MHDKNMLRMTKSMVGTNRVEQKPLTLLGCARMHCAGLFEHELLIHITLYFWNVYANTLPYRY